MYNFYDIDHHDNLILNELFTILRVTILHIFFELRLELKYPSLISRPGESILRLI